MKFVILEKMNVKHCGYLPVSVNVWWTARGHYYYVTTTVPTVGLYRQELF